MAINYMNDALEAERASKRIKLKVDEICYPLSDIDPTFWAAQTQYLRETDPETIEPKAVYCRNEQGDWRGPFPVEKIIEVKHSQPQSGGTCVKYRVLMFGGLHRTIWRDDKEWFVDKEEDNGNTPRRY